MMFRQREPQSSLLATSLLVPPAKAQRLQASWAESFRERALPLLEEELFASLYSDDQGRPNRPVQTVLGVLLLKEMFDLTDLEALEHLEFNLLWHHALQLPPEEAQADGQSTAYGDARSAEGRRRRPVCARDVYRLWVLFGGTAAASLAEYGLLARRLQEQCAVVPQEQRPAPDDDDRSDGGVPVVLKDPPQVSRASLQSPHDPAATYRGHKGKGYELQVAETGHEDNAVEIITQVALTDACRSDAPATLPTLAAPAARGQLPAGVGGDTRYGPGGPPPAGARAGGGG